MSIYICFIENVNPNQPNCVTSLNIFKLTLSI